YLKVLQKLAAAKWRTLKGEKNLFTKLAKTTDFLLQRGFESDLIRAAIEKIRNSDSES
ncbi:MAG: RecX family transcriptional regulator, partial [Gemmatimonadaceae bacterium]|nr:RecX family transcriptional regulator [Chitinophagaceae bacterium]